MATTLFNAKPYDPIKERRKKIRITVVVVIVLAMAFTAWSFRYWRYEHQVDKFFNALQHQDYEKAYGVWMNDPNWKQHPEKYKRYPYGEFWIDWGPGGEWGLIKTYHIDGAVTPKGGTTGVVVQITVNNRLEKCHLWVEKSDKTLAFSPF